MSGKSEGQTNGQNNNYKWDVEQFNRPKRTFKTALPQILASSAKNVLLLGYGMTLGFPTIVIPSLQSGSSNLTLSKEQISWFSSINLIVVPLGCIFSGFVTQPFGRKRSMQFMNIPFIAAWIMFYFADTVEMLYISLALTGLAGGLMEAPVLTYVAEITEPHLRGFLSATASLSVIFGIFTQFLLGNFLHWRTISLVNSSAPVLAMIALCFIPESPHWLIMKNRLKQAEDSLCWLRGWVTADEIKGEYNYLLSSIHPDKAKRSKKDNMEMKNKTEEEAITDEKKTCCQSMENYRKRTFYLPLSLIAFSFFAGHFSGMTTLSVFAVNIFATLGAPIDKYLATLVLGIAQLTGTFLCVVLVHYTGKRPLVFFSGLGSAVCFAAVGFYAKFYIGVDYLDNGELVKSKLEMTGESNPYAWIPLTCLVAGAFLAHAGIRLIPWMLIGEVYPHDVRAFGSGLSGSIGYILGFLSNKTYFTIMDTFTLPGVYWFYGCVGFFSFLVLYFYLPETENWTLIDIQQHFAGVRNLIKEKRKRKSRNRVADGVDNPAMVAEEHISKL